MNLEPYSLVFTNRWSDPIGGGQIISHSCCLSHRAEVSLKLLKSCFKQSAIYKPIQLHVLRYDIKAILIIPNWWSNFLPRPSNYTCRTPCLNHAGGHYETCVIIATAWGFPWNNFLGCSFHIENLNFNPHSLLSIGLLASTVIIKCAFLKDTLASQPE